MRSADKSPAARLTRPLRDVSTPKGLPLATWDKDTFDSVAESLQSTFGIPKSWFSDLVTYDAAELLGGTIGVVSTIFNRNRADAETFAQLAASMGLSAALSANPLLMPVAVVALARAFHMAKSGGSYADVADGAFKGTLASGASMGAVALVGVAGGPGGLALLAGISAAALAHAATRNVELTEVNEFIKGDAASIIRQFAQQAGDTGRAVGALAADARGAVAHQTRSAVGAVAQGTTTATRAAADVTTDAVAATAAGVGAAARRVRVAWPRSEGCSEHDSESSAAGSAHDDANDADSDD